MSGLETLRWVRRRGFLCVTPPLLSGSLWVVRLSVSGVRRDALWDRGVSQVLGRLLSSCTGIYCSYIGSCIDRERALLILFLGTLGIDNFFMV